MRAKFRREKGNLKWKCVDQVLLVSVKMLIILQMLSSSDKDKAMKVSYHVKRIIAKMNESRLLMKMKKH
jgi:hypothetical protein